MQEEDNLEKNNQLKLDYTIQSPEQRNELVKKIIENTPKEKLNHKYLQILSNYIIFAMTKKEKKAKIINTDNRMVTINKRETSFEGLVSKFQNGEDGIYGIITNDKNIIFAPKVYISQQDVEEIPALKELREAIKVVQESQKKATGKKRYLLRKQLIQMRQDQYVIKNSFKQIKYCLNATKSFNTLKIDDNITVTSDGEIIDKSLISLMNSKHISALLCNYSKLKEDCYGHFYTDGYFLMEDLDNLIQEALKDFPLYLDLLIFKIDGKSNNQIQELLLDLHDTRYSIQYISCLWRNKIPKMIAQCAEKKYLEWYYLEKEKGQWKKCTRCNEIKLAHNKFFSKNSSSKDGFYSICKCCRNKKKQEKKNKVKIIKRISYKDYIKTKGGKIIWQDEYV